MLDEPGGKAPPRTRLRSVSDQQQHSSGGPRRRRNLHPRVPRRVAVRTRSRADPGLGQRPLHGDGPHGPAAPHVAMAGHPEHPDRSAGQGRCLPVGRVPARAAAGQLAARRRADRDRREGHGVARAQPGQPARRRRSNPAWATAASAGWPPASSTRWPRMRIPAVGYGIRYEYGIFRQTFVDGAQVEQPDRWLANGSPWEFPHPEMAVKVRFGGQTEHVRGRRWRHPVALGPRLGGPRDPLQLHGSRATGRANVNTLRLWSAQATAGVRPARSSTPATTWRRSARRPSPRTSARCSTRRTRRRRARSCACSSSTSSSPARCATSSTTRCPGTSTCNACPSG